MEKEIKDLTKEEIINPGFIPSIYDNYPNIDERNKILMEISDAAKKFRIAAKIKKEIDKCEKLQVINNNVNAILMLNSQGDAEATTDNYINIMKEDPKISQFFGFDSFSKQYIYFDENGNYRLWGDSDDAKLRSYIEKEYGIYHLQKYYDAFNCVAMLHQYHPIKAIIENEDWDGVPRIDRFMADILKAEDDDYSREVSRMIFYGGINRIYKPGCKFDYMPIFIGKQAAGKSSIISWLAIDDTYYKDISNIEGKDGMNNLDGAWICEMAELLAMVKTKDVESLKAYITRTNDKYRKPYDRRVSENPRQCIFIGTTNDVTFLTDKTGNRRYLPIEIHSSGRDLYANEIEIRKYILQCWREALYLLKNKKTYLVIPQSYLDIVERHQSDAVMDDPRLGLIVSYLDNKEIGDFVCGIELFTNCFNGLKKNFTMSESKEISRIMSMQKDWKKIDDRKYVDAYGQQRGWIKIKLDDISDSVSSEKIEYEKTFFVNRFEDLE